MPEPTTMEKIEQLFVDYPDLRISIPVWQIHQMDRKIQEVILGTLREVVAR